MPPKVKFTQEEVVRAAMAVVEESGLHSLTARRIATRLGASTAPVYQSFATMDALASAVVKETQHLLLDYTSRRYTDRVFLNMGTGVAMFAHEHPELYRALMLESNSYGDVISEFLETLESHMKEDSRLTSLSDIERRELLGKMWVYTHGLASLICVGLIKNCNQALIMDKLMDVGADVIGSTLAKHMNKRKAE